MTASTADAPLRRAIRVGRLSLVWRARTAIVATVGLVLCAALVSLSLGIGEMGIAPLDVLAVLLGGGSPGDRFIVAGLRLPRTLVTVLVGVALGVSGAIVQTITRNPLASPDVIGIMAGASMGAVAAIVLGGGAAGELLGTLGVPMSAVIGGLAAAAAVFALSWRNGVEGFRIVLVGIGVAAVCTALTSLLMVNARVYEAAQAVVWLTGTLDGRTWTHVWPLLATTVVTVPILLPLLHRLGALSLGDASAASLGVRVGAVRFAALLLATLLAAVAVSAAGPIGFVAFVAPQAMMRIVGAPTPPVVVSGLGGAVLLLAADVLTRTILPVGLPVGIVTVVLGAPFFLFLLFSRRRRLNA